MRIKANRCYGVALAMMVLFAITSSDVYHIVGLVFAWLPVAFDNSEAN